MINRPAHIIFFLAALSGCFFFAACENDMNEVDQISKREIGVEEGKNIVSMLSNGGILRAKLTAPVLLRYQTQVPKVEFPNTLHVDFYDSLKNIESQLFAKYGEYKENQNLIYLRDSIVVFNVKGDTLLTNELYWDQNRRIFYNDKPTVVIQTSPRQRLYSKDGLTADQNLQWFTLKSLQPESFTVIPDSTYQ
jgi:LPS export ABC transporter protein LptC